MPAPMRILVAPDPFKGSATASEAALAIADGWLRERPGDDIRLLPLADGGAGTIGDLVDTHAAAASADVIITGEGRFDSQSLVGKVPGYVASIAGHATQLLVAGSSGAPPLRLRAQP